MIHDRAALKFLAARLPLISAALLAAGCAALPATVKRVSARDTRDLHVLLEQALNPTDRKSGDVALGRFIEKWKRDRFSAQCDLEACGSSKVSYHVTVDAYPGLDYYDEIHPASDYRIGRLTDHMRPGIGVPLMTLRENRNQIPIERYFPPEGITRALTAVAHPGPVKNGIQEVRICLLCPLKNDSVIINGQRQPLAADYSVPWAAILSRAGKLSQSRIWDLLTSTPKRKPQIYLMEPYDPDKEPLIMIHGLLSTPLTWAGLSNEVWADDTLRKKYQVWHFLYNTSAPPLYPARLLRGQLKELRHLLDPTGRDPAMQKTTILAHSMGGLVGKALAVSPGDVFWKAAFRVPPEQLKLTPEDRVMLKDAFEWKPDPTIHRIIYVATPHHGSDFADSLAGRIGNWITRTPSPFQKFYARISAGNPGAFTPQYAELGSGRLNSISSLSPRQPTLCILANLPYCRPVSVHCIIGDRGRPGPLEKSSDGIVPYSSSHVDGAVSELIVPADHKCLGNAQVMQEIKRILKIEGS